MFNNLKKVLNLLITLITILMLFSCSVNDSDNIFKNYNVYEEDEVVSETSSAFLAANNSMSRSMKFSAAMTEELASDMSFDGGIGSTMENSVDGEEGNSSRKIIKNYNISAETNNFENAHSDLIKKIDEYEGIVDNSSLYNNNYNNNKTAKHLDMTVRVKSEVADKFVDYLSNILNVTYRSENIEDVTDDYNDVNIRIKTLETEILRLQELLKKAEKVSEIIEIEQKISTSTYDLQKLKNRIANYDKRIAYSTIYINIQEVVVLTEVKENIPSTDKIKQAFDKNLSDTKKFIMNIGIYIFTHIPAIFMVLCVIFIICIFIMIKSKIKNKKIAKVEDVKPIDCEKPDEKLADSEDDSISSDGSDNDSDDNMQNDNSETFDEAYEKLKNNISDDISTRI